MEERLKQYIKDHGITLFSIIRKTGISKTAIYASLGYGGSRRLRAEEYFKICAAIGVDPAMFFSRERKGA